MTNPTIQPQTSERDHVDLPLSPVHSPSDATTAMTDPVTDQQTSEQGPIILPLEILALICASLAEHILIPDNRATLLAIARCSQSYSDFALGSLWENSVHNLRPLLKLLPVEEERVLDTVPFVCQFSWKDPNNTRCSEYTRERIRFYAGKVKDLRFPDRSEVLAVEPGMLECLFEGFLSGNNPDAFFPKLQSVYMESLSEDCEHLLPALSLDRVDLRHIHRLGLARLNPISLRHGQRRWPDSWSRTLEVLRVDELEQAELEATAHLQGLKELEIARQKIPLTNFAEESELSELARFEVRSSDNTFEHVLKLIPAKNSKLESVSASIGFRKTRNPYGPTIVRFITRIYESKGTLYSIYLAVRVETVIESMEYFERLAKFTQLRSLTIKAGGGLCIENSALLDLVSDLQRLEYLSVTGPMSKFTADILPDLVDKLPRLNEVRLGLFVNFVAGILQLPSRSVDRSRRFEFRIDAPSSSPFEMDQVGDVAGLLLHVLPDMNYGHHLWLHPDVCGQPEWVAVVNSFYPEDIS